jgi:soluble lytic murein transglycosylase-like protein
MNIRKVACLAIGALCWGAFLFSGPEKEVKKLYDPLVQQAAAKHGVPAELIHAIIQAESDYDNFALSDKGAMGLMQLMPETAAQYGVRNVFDAAQNIEGGTKYLKDLMNLYGRRTDLVLAAYNAGQEAVRKYGGRIPPYQETRDYIARVKAVYPKPLIRHRIVRLTDESGHVVLTDDPDFFRQKKSG